MAGLAGLAILAFTGRMVALPDFVTEKIEQRVNAAIAPVTVRLGGVDIFFERDGVPQVHLSRVTVSDASGRPVASLPEISAVLAPGPLMSGQLALRRVALNRAELTLRRAPDGSFDLALGETAVPVSHAESFTDVLDGIDKVFAHPMLAEISGLSAERVGLTYNDARAGRIWRIENGLLALTQGETDIGLQLFFSLRNDQGDPSEVAMSFDTVKGSPETNISASFSDMAAADIATQSPALAFLSVIDAPISGAVRSGVTPEGELAPLSAALEIGQGALNPVEGARPIRFNRGKSYFAYQPDTAKITLDEIALDTEVLRLRAEGHAYLKDWVEGWPEAMISQIRFTDVEVAPEGVFEAPARFEGGALDLKLQLDPFTATIGQMVLTDADQTAYRGEGQVRARADGWQVDLDLMVDHITEQRLLSLWPVDLVPGTRRWVANNVLSGTLTDLRSSLRLRPDAPPMMTMSHRFTDSVVRYLKTMPPIEHGQGYANIEGKVFTLVAEKGQVVAPDGGVIDVAGSVMRVPDITQKPADAEITLQTRGRIPPILSLLDLPPLEIMTKAGRAPDLAQGQAEATTVLKVPLKKKVTPQDVEFTVKGRLSAVRSETLVANRVLTASSLDLRASNSEIAISGAARLDGVPVRGSWSQALGPGADKGSRVDGTIELSQATVEAFNIGLPEGSVEGSGLGTIEVNLPRGQTPRFSLTSDLNRVGLSLPGLGWSKPRNVTGRLYVAGTLGETPNVDRLEISAPGLSAEGTVSLRDGGGLDEARFSRVDLGGWLTAPVTLRGQGEGKRPLVVLGGGTMDLRKSDVFKTGQGASSGGGSGGRQVIEVSLGRLIVSEGIALDNVRGVLFDNGTLSGKLAATIGGAPLGVELAPFSGGGTTIRVLSDEAGGVLRGAGIFRNSRGGVMNLRLNPAGQPGHYNGKLSIKNTRVRDAPVLAELLSAVSVIGILEQMSGEGLLFADVNAQFALTPEVVHIKSGSAVGPSLGISVAGIYNLETSGLKMQGVISPVYMLNAIGSVLTRNREGLFGFNYRLRGPASDPRVSVNPLSILTPGMFREIFRSPPPEPEQ